MNLEATPLELVASYKLNTDPFKVAISPFDENHVLVAACENLGVCGGGSLILLELTRVLGRLKETFRVDVASGVQGKLRREKSLQII